MPGVHLAVCRAVTGAHPPPEPELIRHDGHVLALDAGANPSPPDGIDPHRFPASLDGAFAAALWDTGRRRLVLARDRIGIRPLFHAAFPGGLAFASTPTALLASGLIDGAPDLAHLGDLAGFRPGEADATGHAAIRRLLPAHLLEAEGGAVRIRRYWRLPLRGSPPEAHSMPSAAAALRQRLEQAVDRNLPPDEVLAAEVSGGIDSGTVVALAARSPGRRLLGWCFGPPPERAGLGAIDETVYAEAVAQFSGFPLTRIGADQVAAASTALVSVDTPQVPGAGDHRDALLKAAAEAGTRAVLSGYGGDEVASWNGEGAAVEALTRLRFGWLLNSPLAGREPVWRTLGRELKQLIGMGPGRDRHAPIDRFSKRGTRPRARLPLVDTRRIRRRNLERPDFTLRLEEEALLAARHGLVYVYPLLDRALLEWTVNLPASLAIEDGTRRAVFRHAVTDLLPDSVAWRRRKYMVDGTVLAGLVDRAAEIRAELARLARNPRVAAVIDVDALSREIDALPCREEALALIDAATRRGEQVDHPALALLRPLTLARYLDSIGT